MKKMKIIVLLLAIAGSTTIITAQSLITFGTSQLYTNFKFTDSQGTSLDSEYEGIFTNAYTLGYCYVTGVGLMMHVGIGMRKAGATLDFDTMSYSWNLNYANARLGIGYIYQTDFVCPYLNVSGYYGLMVSGSQIINNEHFNILKSKTINDADYGLSVSPGVQLKFSKNVSAFIELEYLMGMQNIEKKTSQESKNIAYGATLGIAYSFGK